MQGVFLSHGWIQKRGQSAVFAALSRTAERLRLELSICPVIPDSEDFCRSDAMDALRFTHHIPRLRRLP